MESLARWKRQNGRVLRSFSTDGCSSSPDGSFSDSRAWVECCVHHDIEYWIGGTKLEKRHADSELEKCIAEKGYPEVGKAYRLAVDNFGSRKTNSTFRWGYGWNYKRNYTPLSETEISEVVQHYGMGVEETKQYLKSSNFQLYRMCSLIDGGLGKLTLDEKIIFELLSKNVLKEDKIEWGKLVNYNLVENKYHFKLHSCAEPVLIKISKRNNDQYSIESKCKNVKTILIR